VLALERYTERCKWRLVDKRSSHRNRSLIPTVSSTTTKMDSYVVLLFTLTMLCTSYDNVRSMDMRTMNKCKPHHMKFCSGLYNHTHLERSLDEAILDLNQYTDLASSKCSEHTRLFLCGTFLPMCTMLMKPLRPCRSLCEEVKGGCERVIKKYTGLPWPKQLNCKQFHEYSATNLCIGKNKNEEEVIYNRIPPNKRKKVKDEETVQLHCNTLEKINFKKILHDDPHRCDRSRSVAALRKLCNNEQTCEFKLDVAARAPGQRSTCIAGKVGTSTIKYQCTKDSHAKKMVLKYGEDENLFCKSSARHISILKVQFKDDSCISPKVFCSVSQACTGKQKCALWANYYYLQSPCQGKKVKLEVDYECVKTNPNNDQRELVAKGFLKDGIELKCPNRITIIRAEYWNPGATQFCQLKQIHCAVTINCDQKKKCRLDEQNLEAVLCKEALSHVRIRYTCR